MHKFIAVAGNIGVGKSTLVSLICKRFGWEPFYEPAAENPYMADFYQNMPAWSFHSQIFFLTHRLRSHLELVCRQSPVVQDRSIYEDAEVFAKNLALQGFLSERDYATYRSLYETVANFLPHPDLVIYLRASISTLIRHIEQRGRSYERRIDPDYLGRLNNLYETWIAGFSSCPVLTIPADDLDYVAHTEHLDLVIAKIQGKLSGVEEIKFG